MHDPEDQVANPGTNPSFREVLRTDRQRRRLLQGGLGAAALSFLGLPAGLAPRPASAAAYGFGSVPIGVDDSVHVPDGYLAEV
ncbi:MAG TPA: phosphatase, partial [Burkholderiales bacterium]|nr:phosphatase [Burkholderiales bacterium]